MEGPKKVKNTELAGIKAGTARCEMGEARDNALELGVMIEQIRSGEKH